MVISKLEPKNSMIQHFMGDLYIHIYNYMSKHIHRINLVGNEENESLRLLER